WGSFWGCWGLRCSLAASSPPTTGPRYLATEADSRGREGGRTPAALADKMEDPVYVDDLDIPVSKLTDAARRVVDGAIEESRRREHSHLTSAHLFFVLAHSEWELFAHLMRSVSLNPHEILRSMDEHLRRVASVVGCEVRV